MPPLIKNWKPIVFLFISSFLLTELLTGSTPLKSFLSPFIVLLFITVGYGFPVLVIREISIRKNFGLLGLFFLGVIYGLYNEGLFAKTIINPFHSPVASFTAYGLLGSIRLPWALAISSWHALYAVIFPIIIVYYFFPERSSENWLSKKTTYILGVISFISSVLFFFSGPPQNKAGTPNQFIFIMLSWLVLWWLAKRFSQSAKVSIESHFSLRFKKFIAGPALYLGLFLLPVLLSKANVPPGAFYLYFLIIVFFLIKKISKFQTLYLNDLFSVVLWGEIAAAGFSAFLSLAFHKLDLLATSLGFIILFSVLLRRLNRKNQAI